MSNDTHQHDPKQSEITKSKVSFSSSFWFIVILIVLFVSALNFVNVMSNSKEEKAEPQKTEEPAASGKDEKVTPVENQVPNTNGTNQMSSDTAHK